jgi:hypothetical protein
MGLPWVRLDTNMPSHDKILALLSDPSPKKWQAAFSWSCSIAWSGGHDTDGRVPPAALGAIHATPTTADLLVKYRLWANNCDGWEIVNFAKRNQTAAVTEAKEEALSVAGRKANCVRHHGSNDWVEGKGCYRLDGPFD